MALTQSGSSPVSRTPQICGIVRWQRLAGHRERHLEAAGADGQHAQRARRRQVWLSEPTSVLPGVPKRCMWTGWLTPLPGWLYHRPKRRQALRRNRWSSAFRWSAWSRLWSTYCDRQLGLDPVEAHRLELQHDQRAGGVLRERLVDPQRDLAAGRHVAVDQVRLDQLLRNVPSHATGSLYQGFISAIDVPSHSGTSISSTFGYSSVMPAFLITSPQWTSSVFVNSPSSLGPMCTA